MNTRNELLPIGSLVGVWHTAWERLLRNQTVQAVRQVHGTPVLYLCADRDGWGWYPAQDVIPFTKTQREVA